VKDQDVDEADGKNEVVIPKGGAACRGSFRSGSCEIWLVVA